MLSGLIKIEPKTAASASKLCGGICFMGDVVLAGALNAIIIPIFHLTMILPQI